MRYVRDIHYPIHMMVLSVALLSFITIAPPARRLCNDTLSTVYPLATRLSYVAPHRTAIVTSRSEIRVVPVGGWYTALSGVEARMPRRFAIRRASAATGQISPPNASWCTNAPFVPFLVLAIAMVALSALTRVGSPNSRSRSWPLHQRRTSHSALSGCHRLPVPCKDWAVGVDKRALQYRQEYHHVDDDFDLQRLAQ